MRSYFLILAQFPTITLRYLQVRSRNGFSRSYTLKMWQAVSLISLQTHAVVFSYHALRRFQHAFRQHRCSLRQQNELSHAFSYAHCIQPHSLHTIRFMTGHAPSRSFLNSHALNWAIILHHTRYECAWICMSAYERIWTRMKRKIKNGLTGICKAVFACVCTLMLAYSPLQGQRFFLAFSCFQQAIFCNFHQFCRRV